MEKCKEMLGEVWKRCQVSVEKGVGGDEGKCGEKCEWGESVWGGVR